MKWFKHDATAHIDSKLKRVRAKYGMEGYGLYWYCLELIAKNVETHNLSFILEEDSELISAETNIHYERVQEMMLYMVDLGLFEQADGLLSCLKMATRTDEYTAKLLRKSGECPDKLPTVSGQSPSYKKEEKEEKEIGARKRALPSDFEVDDSMQGWVTQKFPALEWSKATEEWLDYVSANGRKYVDWRKAWQSGMRKADQWRAEKTPASEKQWMGI